MKIGTVFRGWLSVVAFFLVITAVAGAQPVRLAIVATDESLLSPADLLTVELSRPGQVTLLERNQVGKAFKELALSATIGVDYLKLGQILGADGLLVLEPAGEAGRQLLSARLIAVKPGVILEMRQYPWPLRDLAQWSALTAKQFQPLFPKLAVLSKEAVPISVLNLHSALRTRESAEFERELTQLLIDRLSREPELFVLERQHMREMMFEQKFKPREEESAFWTGRYLLDGILDKEGFNAGKITISARLVSPKGGAPTLIDVTGPRNDPVQIVESLAVKVLAGLQRDPAAREWFPRQEADQYYEEAQWDHGWGLMREAQEASESAWALGRRTRDAALLRMRAYADDHWTDPSNNRFAEPYETSNWYLRYDRDEVFADPAKLKPALRALELFCHDAQSGAANGVPPDTKWLELGMDILNRAGGLLENFYYVAEMRQGNESQLAELRSMTRQLVSILETNKLPRPGFLNELKWLDGGLWFEKPEEALQMQRRVIEAGLLPVGLPCVAGWSWEDRKRIPGLIRQFAQDVRHSTNSAVRREGLYLELLLTPQDETGKLLALENELFETLWNGRREMLEGKADVTILERLERRLQKKHETVPPQFNEFMRRLRKEYLFNMTVSIDSFFNALFPNFGSEIGEDEARDLLPRLREVKSKLDSQGKFDLWLGNVITMLTAATNGSHIPATALLPGAATPSKQPAIGPVPTAERPVIVNFKNWNLPDLKPGFQPQLQSAIFRRGKLWFHVRFQNAFPDPNASLSCFAAVDPRLGVTETIPFPEKLGFPDPKFERSNRPFFEVTEDSLIVSVQDRLQRYRFREKRWETIPIPVEGGAQITEQAGHVYLTSGGSFLELMPDFQAVKIIASNRRRPTVNLLDQIGGFRSIFHGPNGRVGLLAGRRLFVFTPGDQNFDEIKFSVDTAPLEKSPNFFMKPAVSDGGMVLLMGGWAIRDYVLAVWNDSPGMETLLQQAPNLEPHPPPDANQPTRWNWPQPCVLKAALVLAEGKALWTLNPRLIFSLNRPAALSLKYDDDRNATLIRFEPEFRDGLGVPIKFEKDGQPFDPFDVSPMATSDYTRRGEPFWLDTPDGLVMVSPGTFPPSPGFAGHWLISKSRIEPRLDTLRKQMREKAKRTATPGVQNAATAPGDVKNSTGVLKQ